MTRAVLVVMAAACSAPALPSELARAYEREQVGDVAGALESYRTTSARLCGRPTPSRRQRDDCANALIGEAELLEREGELEPAIAAYAMIQSRSGGAPAASSLGLFRAGRLAYQRNQVSDAASYLWKAVTDYPDEPAAGDAIGFIAERTRRLEPQVLWARLSALYPQIDHREVADNLLWTLADLAEHEFADPIAARTLYDRIAADYPTSGLIDDARWRAAQLSRAQGDANGAVSRLRALLATREVSIGVGSYFSVWLDDAQLLLGQILRDDLQRVDEGAAAFAQLPKDYPHSILIDDALDELATTSLVQSDVAEACRASARLLAHDPESKYAARARDRSSANNCPVSGR